MSSIALGPPRRDARRRRTPEPSPLRAAGRSGYGRGISGPNSSSWSIVRLGGTQLTMVTVFVSSGDDALANRDYIDRLVADAVNVALQSLKLPVRFEVDRWERTAAHRMLPGAEPNQEFVARAKAANLVVSVLIDKLGQGTREELEAVLAEDDVELSIIWCEQRDNEPNTQVSRWLSRQRNEVLYDRADHPKTDGPRIALTRLFMEAMLTAVRDHAAADLWTEVRR